MREILFRGKRCDNAEWVQGFYVRADHHWHKHGIHKDWIICGASANGGWFALHNKYAVKSGTVGQFTGLTDKNGKKIFEGDIIKTRRSGTRIEKLKGYYGYDSEGYPQKIPGYDGVSEYSYSCQIDCYAKVEYDPMNGGFYLNGGDMFVGAICNEVVGNIHDNPELLGDK